VPGRKGHGEVANYTVGNAYLQVMPSFRGIEKMMQREVGKLARDIDKSIAQGTNDGILKAFRQVDASKIAKSAGDSGDKWASAFEQQINRHLKDAAKELPEFEPKANLSKFDRAIRQTQRRLQELGGMKIGPGADADLNYDQAGSELDKLISRMNRLGEEARNTDQKMRLATASNSASTVRGLIDEARGSGETDGRTYGGAFSQAAKARIDQALKALPEVKLDADASPAERAVAALRVQLETLSQKKIGIDIDRDRFQQELGYITAQLESLARDPKSLTLKYDLDQAAAGLRKFGDQVEPALKPDLEEAGDEGGDTYAGSFVDKMQKRIASAIKQIPNAPMKVDNTDAERQLAAIRVNLEELSEAKIGVDIDAATAEAKLAALKERLNALDRDDVSIDVRTNAAAALAELTALKKTTDDTGLSFTQLGRQGGITMSRLAYIFNFVMSIGTAIVPVFAAASVGVAGLGTAAAGAASGLGVLALGLFGVFDAVGKINAYYQDQEKSAKSLSAADNRVASAKAQVENAERSLANTRASNEEAAASAKERIVEAERDLGKAKRDTREALTRATDADEDAQRRLTRANSDQNKARQELNKALRDAVGDLAELDAAVKKNGNEIDKATTASMKAKLELDKLLTNPRSSEIEKRMAREKYEEELISIQDLKAKRIKLLDDQKDADKRGVESIDNVKKAREKLAAADEQAADAKRTKDRAAAALDGVRLDNVEKIHDAEHKIVLARVSAARTERQGRAQLVSGNAQLEAGQRALRQAYIGTGVAGGEALDNMKTALEELSPAGQEFAQFLYDLKPKFKELRDEAQKGMLPGFQVAIKDLVDTYLPSFKQFVGEVAEGIGRLAVATAKVTKLPGWQAFFSYIRQTTVPTLNGLWVVTENIARGIANLVVAFKPFNKGLGDGLINLTSRFAEWSESLDKNKGFQEFLEYAKVNGPKVVELISDMVEFIGRFAIAAAPIGGFVVEIADGFFKWMNSWDPEVLSGLAVTLSSISIAVLGISGVMRGIRFVTEIYNGSMLLASKFQDGFSAALLRYRVAALAATGQTTLLNGAVATTYTVSRGAAGALTALKAAAGPIGLLLVGIGSAYLLYKGREEEVEAQTDTLGSGLEQLGEAWRNSGVEAGKSSSKLNQSLQELTASNEDLQRLVTTLEGLGLSSADVAAAAGGDFKSLEKGVQALNREMARVRFEDGALKNTTSDKVEVLKNMRDELQNNANKARAASEALRILNQETDKNYFASLKLSPTQRALADAHDKLADKTATAEEKMKALQDVQEAMRKQAVDQIEAQEEWAASIDGLKSSIQGAKDAQDKNATSLSLWSEQGRRNRDELEKLIGAADRMYDADVALNGVTKDAVTRGQDHYTQIRKVARELGLNKKETQQLIETYGKIPNNIETAIAFKEGDFQKMYTQLEQAAFIQDALRRNKSLPEAQREWEQMQGHRLYQRYVPNRPGNIPGKAVGGPIDGIGGPTEDANLIWASKGEHMLTAKEVQAAGGHDAILSLRRALLEIPRHATGGPITGGKATWPFRVALNQTYIPTAEDLSKQVGDNLGGVIGGVLGKLAGSIGYRWQFSTLKKVFPDIKLFSGYRHTYTDNGSLSWHGRDGGRAVDVTPRMSIFKWIRENYGANTKELIWGGAPEQNLYRGKPHRYSDSLLYRHGPYKGKPGPSPHIHWAYDAGGMLPPGVSTVFNGTGRPEPVLTAPQWEAVIKGDGQGSGDEFHNHYDFGSTRLTLDDLDAHQQRRSTLARQGRPR
jgi:hypothetical protein